MTMTRRCFMGWMGAAAVGSLVPGAALGARPDKQFSGHAESSGVLHDITRCIGCRRCEAACNRVHELGTPDRPFDDLAVMDLPRRTHHQAFTVVNRYAPPAADSAADGFRGGNGAARAGQGAPVFVKTQCNHCLEPACASACFVKAFKKYATGAVVYDESLCVGCRYCMIACPFNIPTYEYDQPLTPRIRKCDLCHQRQLAGLPPGCVADCPKEALTFGPRNALIDVARRRIGEHSGRYIPHIYGEHEMGGTSWLYLSGVSFAAVGMNERLGNLPASAFTANVLETIPIVVGLWPVLLTGIYAISRRKDAVAEQERRDAVAAVTAEAEAQAREQLAAMKKTHMADKDAAVLKAVEKALAEAASKGAAPEA